MPTSGNIERALGVVIGKLESIEVRLGKQDESRAALHKRVDELVMRTTHLESDLMSVKNQVRGVEQVTDDVKTLRQQAQGAGTLGQWLVRIGIGVIGFAGWFVGVYTWLTGKPPP